MSRLKKNESGATAILFALLAVVLFAAATCAVDFGNAWARKRDVQTQADLAALAGAANLPSEYGDTATLDAVLDYLQRNEAWAGQDTSSLSTAILVDGDETNGEVYWPNGESELRVVAPQAEVQFGFAPAIGALLDPDSDAFEKVDVQAEATVGLRTPGQVGPFFMLNPPGCSFGRQYLKAGPQSDGDDLDVPSTWTPAGQEHNGDFEVTRVTTLEVEAEELGERILIEGTTKSAVSSTTQARVHFSSASESASVDVTPTWSGSKTNGRYPWSVEVIVPGEVTDGDLTDGEATWWIRLERLDTHSFTGNDTAKSFNVEHGADTEDECGEKNTGDFGLIDSPRSDVNEEKEAYSLNTQFGLDHQLSIHPSPGSMGVDCKDISLSVFDDEYRPDGTNANCVRVENGGKVSYVGTGLFGDYDGTAPDGTLGPHHGLLRQETSAYCQAKHLPKYTTDEGYSDVNADTLECFLDGGSIEEAGSPTYSGDPILAPEIFDSPRLMWVPLLNAEANPGNGDYPVVGFRPVFITEADLNHGGGVQTIKVIALNEKALPGTVASSAPGLDYIGTGPKILRLIK